MCRLCVNSKALLFILYSTCYSAHRPLTPTTKCIKLLSHQQTQPDI